MHAGLDEETEKKVPDPQSKKSQVVDAEIYKIV